jgi:hypothetical protein
VVAKQVREVEAERDSLVKGSELSGDACNEGILLDDCMLDVSMLGSAMAADVFVHARVPREDIRPVAFGASLVPPR